MGNLSQTNSQQIIEMRNQLLHAIFPSVPNPFPFFLWLARIDRSVKNQVQTKHSNKEYAQKALLWGPKGNQYIDNIVDMWCTQNYDVYFCPHASTSNKYRTKSNIDKVSCVWAELDECHPDKLKIQPSFVWRTSPNKYQALWLLENPVSGGVAEHISKRIAVYHEADGCDLSGYDLSQLLRLPGTRNYKYPKAPLIEFVLFKPNRIFRPSDFTLQLYPDVPKTEINEYTDVLGLPNPEEVELCGLVEYLLDEGEDYFETPKNGEYDRSGMIYHLLQVCREQGYTKGQMVAVLQEYQPYLGKVRDYGAGWARRSWDGIMKKLDERHPHDGYACKDVDCRHCPANEVVRFVTLAPSLTPVGAK